MDDAIKAPESSRMLRIKSVTACFRVTSTCLYSIRAPRLAIPSVYLSFFAERGPAREDHGRSLDFSGNLPGKYQAKAAGAAGN